MGTTLAIIGSGNIGGTLAKLAVNAGYEVLLANSRGPESLQATIDSLGPTSCAATVEEACARGDLVIEAIPFGRVPNLPSAAIGEKVLVTAANYYPERDGKIDLGGVSHSEWVARHFPGACIVKAFNTIWFKHLASQGDTSQPQDARRFISVASDDAAARAPVLHLVDRLGFGGLELPTLAAASPRFEPGGELYNVDLTLAEAQARLA
ncbi:MAG: NAD(P)-binding domain-containing protein [Myxococcota bacterium]